jgi:hypothetical protein
MDAERSTYCVPKRSLLNLGMLGKDLNPLSQTRSLYRHAQLLCQVVDVNAALSREQWDRKKDPEVASPFTHLECGLHAILGQLVRKLDQVIHGVRVVGVDRDPLAPLVGRVDGVETDRYPSLQVVGDGLFREQQGPT